MNLFEAVQGVVMELGIVELLQHLGQDVVEGVYAHRVVQTVEGLGGRCPDLDKETKLLPL